MYMKHHNNSFISITLAPSDSFKGLMYMKNHNSSFISITLAPSDSFIPFHFFHSLTPLRYIIIIIITTIIIITMSRSEYNLVSNPVTRYSGKFNKDKQASLVAFGGGQSGRVAFLRLPKVTVQVGSIQEGDQEELVGYFLFPSFA
jgi:hypothetical protein